VSEIFPQKIIKIC